LQKLSLQAGSKFASYGTKPNFLLHMVLLTVQKRYKLVKETHFHDTVSTSKATTVIT